MKKRIFIIIVLLLFTTGCTCEYNLSIENNIFKEETKITSSTSNELSSFSTSWKIPTDKSEYNVGLDPESTIEFNSNLYKYNLSGNVLSFKYDFSISDYPNSSAVSNCYNTLNIINRIDSIIISTSKENKCFDNYPNLEALKINIKIDTSVKSHNADVVNGNTYTWNITKNNANNKPINLVLTNNNNSGTNNNQNDKHTTEKKDYTLYIFCGILLVIMLCAYFIINKIKNNKDIMDD